MWWPAMFPITVSKVLSAGVSRYIDVLLKNDDSMYPENLAQAVVIRDGHILDQRIKEFREARNLFCL